ncbi:Probable cytochrome P450 301a1, mitochondrial [Eumeta japonica]|uniref:Probable cytochrome P450 301a1, mitochondrial n=1 Tax=Eumeta variegata TaxID=151549 RepID=A0A4C1XIA1_EUMVA|nr:Probable cytochrome P450 301a1, mitochondrial [Eumeta japonica]
MRLTVVSKWPRRTWILREFSTAARISQTGDTRDTGALAPSVKTQCPSVTGSGARARSTNAILHEDIFDGSTTTVRPWEEVPGPKPLPLVGNTWRFIPYVGGYSVRHVDKVCTALWRQYGRCVRLAGLLGRPDMLFVFDAAEVERVFRSEDGTPSQTIDAFSKLLQARVEKGFFWSRGKLRRSYRSVNICIITADKPKLNNFRHGESWAVFRAKVARVVLSAGAALRYAQQVADVADDFIQRVREVRTSEMETPGDILNEIHKWSLESLGLIALDTRLGCFHAKEGKKFGKRALDRSREYIFLCVGDLELRAPWWRLYPTKTFKRYIAALDTILRCSISVNPLESIFNHLDRDSSWRGRFEGQRITLQHVDRSLKLTNSKTSLLNQLVAAAGPRVATVAALDMFLVGIDTTSNAVASILYQLSLRPEVQERLFEEISSVLQGRTLQPGDLAQMPYLKACVKEVLRMYPVVIGNGRQLTKDTIICGYNIPKGTQVIFQHYVMGNSDEYFTEASEFRPERWLSRQPGDRHHAFASLPFGYGKRMCLGRRFAELEIQTVVCKMIQAFRMSYDHELLDYHIHPMYTPDGPIRLTLVDR